MLFTIQILKQMNFSLHDFRDGIQAWYDIIAIGYVLAMFIIALSGFTIPADQQLGSDIKLADAQINNTFYILILNTGSSMNDKRNINYLLQLLQTFKTDICF